MLVQADLEIPIPHYFISEPSKETQERKAMLTQLLKKVKVAPSQEVNGYNLKVFFECLFCYNKATFRGFFFLSFLYNQADKSTENES